MILTIFKVKKKKKRFQINIMLLYKTIFKETLLHRACKKNILKYSITYYYMLFIRIIS